jgi:transcriptional regulator of met regulon
MKPLTEQESQIIKVKYSANKINQLTDGEINLNSVLVLKRIHVITGWNFPNDADFIKILNDEFVDLLKKSFGTINFNEVLEAFRVCGIGVIDWGKSINISLLKEVLNDYLVLRFDASLNEERMKSKPLVQKVQTKDELDNEARQRAVNFFNLLRKGTYAEIPTDVKNILMQDFKIEDKNIYEFVSDRCNKNLCFYEKK